MQLALWGSLDSANKIILSCPQGPPHIVSEYFVQRAMVLCPPGQDEHFLHCLSLCILENVFPSWHGTQVINSPYGTTLPHGCDGSNPDQQTGQSKHPYSSFLVSIHVFWSGSQLAQTVSADGLQGLTTVSFNLHCEHFRHGNLLYELENVPLLHSSHPIKVPLFTMLPQDTDGSWPGWQESQGQQSFSTVSWFITSILSLGQLRKQLKIVSYKRKKLFRL